MRALVRSSWVLVAVLATILLSPTRAWAHAALVESEPAAGSELSIAPGVVTLSFTEPLNERLSRIVVIAPDGERFEGAAVEDTTMRARLTTNQPGVYSVEWTTVSLLDGHALQGSLAFGVGVAPSEGDAVAVSSEPRMADIAVALLRAVEFVGLLLAFGSLLLRRLGRRDPALSWVQPPVRGTILVAAAAGSLVVIAEALVASPDASLGSVWAYLSTGLPGAARIARVGVEWIAFVLAARGFSWAGLALVGATGSLAAAGHAAAAEPRWFAVAVDMVHVVAAGMWAGAVLALAFVRPPDGWRGAEGRRLLDRFTPVALVAFVVTVSAGVLRGFQELSTFSDLIRTSYGVTLTAKILAVLVMAQLSVFAWRRVVGSLRGEATVAVLVVALAALLAAYPLPPGRLAETEAEEHVPETSIALPRDGDLTLGSSAGEVLIGLTLRPGEPGSNEAFVYLRPLEGEDAAAGMPVSLVVRGRAMQMSDCGPACRRAEVDLVGNEEVQVRVDSPVGGTATFDPQLPAPEGTRTLRRAQTTMHGLRSYLMNETLSSGLADVFTEYAFEAPDRARIEVRGGSSSVFLGTTRYVRQAPGADWRIERRAPRLTVPSFVWDSFRPFLDVRVVGSELIGDRRTTVVSFFGARGDLPIWFRLWVEPRGRVLRAEMRTQGHFMDQRYFDFNAPISVEAPDVGQG
ncbi:MAG: copper resistance protein CopC [Actinomycetota bacterium]